MQNFISQSSFVANEYLAGNSNETLAVVDKYSHQLLSEVSLLSHDQMVRAIDLSHEAFLEFKNFNSQQRSELLFKLTGLLQVHKESFARLISAEAGKPISYARAEVDRAAFTLQYAASEAMRINGEVIGMNFTSSLGREAFTKKIPLGVIACFAPFNFPLNLAVHKIAPALAAGNAVVIKPSPYTPLSLLAFANLIKEAGFPANICNVVVCDNDVASVLVTHEKTKMLSFTGSAHVGWMLKEKANKKKVTLELGGNAACIVDRSADIEDATTKLVNGAFLYSGQICISTQRIYVDSSVYEEFIETFLEKAEEVVCGDPNNDKTIVGPLIDEMHVKRIHSWVLEAVSKGAEVLMGGYILDEDHNIYAPTILTNTTSDMKVVSEEIFGPVVIIERSDYFDEAIELVNESKYGLQAGLFTNDLEQMKYALEKIEVAGLIINNIPGFRMDHMPYGGIKESGFGREGVKYAIDDMTELKLLVF